MVILWTAAFFIFKLIIAKDQDEKFEESLEIIQNINGKVGMRFDFISTVPASNHLDFSTSNHHLDLVQNDKSELVHNYSSLKSTRNNRLLAKSISDLIERFKVKELHLSFTQGRWTYDRWEKFAFSDKHDPPVPPGNTLSFRFQIYFLIITRGIIKSMARGSW